jgi:hypothetical protein
MKYLKAVAGGIVGTILALILAWLLGAIATTAYLKYIYSHGRTIDEAFPLPMWTAWFILPIPFLASAGGFWAGFRFTLALQRDIAQRSGRN